MINGITYFKLKSPYNGDVTKNCALTGPEIDNNFFTLEGRDIKSLSVEDSDIVLNLVNGDKIKAKDILENFIVNVSFDNDKGVLKIFYQDGRIEELKGFAAQSYNGFAKVAVNETMEGTGTPSNPIGVSSSYKTGQYKPVNGIVETIVSNTYCSDGCICNGHVEIKNPKPGDRYIVSEKIGAYGFLYNFKDATQIACELKKANSKWRIPTKEDWDDMLNGVEPCECDRDHSKSVPNKYLGKWAGKLLKSKYYWKKDNGCDCNGFDNEYFADSCDCNNTNPCKPTYCGEMNETMYHHSDASGIDKYGFGVVPAGYADDAGNILFFGERAAFWTSTNMHFTNIFEKRFEFNKTKVYQDVIPGQNYLSIRLVKDYDGDNYHEAEEILGQTYPTVLMPSASHGKAIWTAVNVSFTGRQFKELVPNYGHDMAFITKYFIDEWDGKKWLRNEFKEGDSVVVKEDPKGKIDIEYRLVNGKLIKVSDQIYEDVVESFNPVIKNLEEKLTNEINRSKTKDNELEDKLEDLNERANTSSEKLNQLEEKIENVDTKVNNTNQLLASFGEETKKAFDIINDVLTQSINNINNAIQTEHNERVEDVKNLNDKIDSIQKDSNEKYDTLSEKLKNEVERLDGVNEELTKNLEELEGKQIVQEGTSFNTENGILTLKSQNGENDIEVQFVLNMGKF